MDKRSPLATAADVAEYLQVREHTVYRWCRLKKIPHFDLNSTYRFDMDAIRAWSQSRDIDQDTEEIRQHTA